MKELDLRSYEFEGIKVDVKKVLASLLFRPELKLSARDLITQAALAEKIELAGDSVLLEDAEYAKVKRPFDIVTGWGRGDLQLIKRVMDAVDVEIEKAKKPT